MGPIGADQTADIRELRCRIAELEAQNLEQGAELATARALLAATWPGCEIPAAPVPVELTHALRGPAARQAVRLVIDGVRVIAGVRGSSAGPDPVRELNVWAAVRQFARCEKGRDE